MQRLIAYIDGFNLYYGLRSKNWKWAYWLNIQALVRNLLKPDQTLVTTKYFTTIIKHPLDRNRRQLTYLEALQTLDNFHIYYGHFLSQQVICQNCGHTHITHHEKMTDVNIAVEMLTDVFHDKLDIALLITGDSDLVGPIQTIKNLYPQKRIIVAFPPNRKSSALKKIAHGYTHISRAALLDSLFPDVLTKTPGVTLKRPLSWS